MQWSIVHKICFFTMPVAPTLMQECPAPHRCKYFPPEKQICSRLTLTVNIARLDGKYCSLRLIDQGISHEKFTRGTFLLLTICQTCMILSSDTEHITHGSLGFHEKSEILAVCPP